MTVGMVRQSKLVLAGLAFACTQADSDGRILATDPKPVWTTESAWKLSEKPRVVIGPGDLRERPEGKPLDPVTFFETRDGRYVISDGRMAGWHALLLYNAEGKFLEQLGQEGEGPAEFKHHSSWAGQIAGDSIAGYDESLRRLQIWTSEGVFGRTAKLPESNGLPYFLRDGGMIIGEPPPIQSMRGRRRVTVSIRYNLYGRDGNLIRELMSVDRDLADQPSPDAPNYATRWLFAAGDSRWYVAEWSAFRVEVYDTSGQLQRVLERALPPTPFDAEEREEVIRLRLRWAGMGTEGVRGSAMSDFERALRRNARWPLEKPAIQRILEDDLGNVWVQHYYFILAPTGQPRDGRLIVWSVFSPNGTFLGEVSMPPRFFATSIKEDRVLGLWSDEDGVKHALVYDLIKPDHERRGED